jgi:glucose-1-phosphate thymidylyltransferase
MKGLVLAGGRGSRLRPITYSMAKQLVPVANRPIIEFGLGDLVSAGITDIGVVVSPETGQQVAAAVEAAALRMGFTPTFITQDQPLGLAHALSVALPFIDGDDCLMYLGDNLIKDGIADVVGAFEEERPNCQIMLSRVPNPSAFGVAELADDGKVVRLVEKPEHPPSDLALVGVYLFDRSIAEAVHAITPSSRGELEITDAIQHLIDTGCQVRAAVVSGWWKDTGTKDDLLIAQHLVIADLAHDIAGDVSDSTTLEGAIHVGRGSHLIDCHVTGPTVIGDGATLRDTVVGAHTAIGDGCDIADSVIEDSIVMKDSHIAGWHLRASVIGRNARLGAGGPRGPVEMTLGDGSSIDNA